MSTSTHEETISQLKSEIERLKQFEPKEKKQPKPRKPPIRKNLSLKHMTEEEKLQRKAQQSLESYHRNLEKRKAYQQQYYLKLKLAYLQTKVK